MYCITSGHYPAGLLIVAAGYATMNQRNLASLDWIQLCNWIQLIQSLLSLCNICNSHMIQENLLYGFLESETYPKYPVKDILHCGTCLNIPHKGCKCNTSVSMVLTFLSFR